MHAIGRIARFAAGKGHQALQTRSFSTSGSGPASKSAWAWITAGAAAGSLAAFTALQGAAEAPWSEKGEILAEELNLLFPEPKEPDLWDKWAQVKAFLTSWRRRRGADDGGGGGTPSLPLDKLKCHLPPGGFDPGKYRPLVLVSCGSFNPPTHMHLRMMELAQQAMAEAGYDVLGGYLSPVNDAYWKRALAPGRQRVRMCQLATADSDFLMVDPWEVEQRQYTRTLHVLRHVERELHSALSAGEAPTPEEAFRTSGEPQRVACPTSPPPRVMLVCGADVVLSMADPVVWRQDLLEELLSRHGLVCITRNGSDVAALLQRPGTLLHTYRENVAVVKEPVPNDISSSRVRHELEQGRSAKYLVPEPVIQYIYQHGLYNSGAAGAARRPALLRAVGEQKVAGKEAAGRGLLPAEEPPKKGSLYIMVFDPTLGILVGADDLAAPHPL